MSSPHRRTWLALAVSLACASALPMLHSPLVAQPAAAPELYESARVQRALDARSWRIDQQPGGKRIAFIAFAREEVLVDDELALPVVLPRFAPTWPNMLHTLTREHVIERELLVAVGDGYDQHRIDESARNLRAMAIFALVRIVAVQSDDASAVGLLVYTRDLWSLRLETVFSGTGSAFGLTAQLTERNLFGAGKVATLRFDLDPKAWSLGQVYQDRRLADQELFLYEYFDVIMNRASGRPEGSQGHLSLGRVFYTLEQQWSWNLTATYLIYVARSLRGSELVGFAPDDSGELQTCEAAEPECLLSVWRDRSLTSKLSGSYRRGTRYKQTFTLGAGFSTRKVEAVAETDLSSAQAEAFERLILPRVRRQAYPYVSYDLRLPDYAVFNNLSTFGQSESVRIGPYAVATVAAPLSAFGSSSDSMTFAMELGYVLGDGEALAEAWVSGYARWEEGAVLDQSLSGLLRGATPLWLWGRIVGLASFYGQRRDSSQAQVVLGGDSGLRGYPSGAFRVVGGNRLRASVEYRSLPLVFASVHVGATVFYDAGSVYRSLSRAEFHHAAGVGVRVLFPQVNLTPFRMELGVPLDRRGFSVLLSYGTEQAVPLTAADDLAVAASVRAR
jgi:hypothetical protein